MPDPTGSAGFSEHTYSKRIYSVSSFLADVSYLPGRAGEVAYVLASSSAPEP